jgi:ABC-type phosphate/phosphonate transport system substrate-binding protein
MSYLYQAKILVLSLFSICYLAFSSPVLAQAQTTLRVTTIPEEAATEQVRKFAPLAAYLEKQLDMKVQFTPVTDYPAAVESLVNKKVDLVWFGLIWRLHLCAGKYSIKRQSYSLGATGGRH